ncbi:MAG: hypothetical protein NC123_04965 [Butyrivibrio sp.]|nr:hypothetical protein [Butyrivibrio sp.]
MADNVRFLWGKGYDNMNILYDEQARIFKLDTTHTSYLIGLADEEGFIGHVYYGKTISVGFNAKKEIIRSR